MRTGPKEPVPLCGPPPNVCPPVRGSKKPVPIRGPNGNSELRMALGRIQPYHGPVTISVLHDFHAGLGARFMPVNGVEFVASYSDVLGEHRALHEGAGVIDLSGRGRLVLLGADRQKLLNGQVTNNIKDLPVGKGCYAALVNAKAKMVADLNVFALASELLLDLEPGLAGPVAERLEKFIVADDVQIVDAAPHYGLLSIQGRHAPRTIEQLGFFPELPAEPLAHAALNHPEHGELYLMNHPRLGHRGFDLFVPQAALAPVADRLITVAREFGGRPCGFEAFEIARMEAGIPRYGVDMDESNLPPECGIESRAISYTKGCYSGQEVIARIRTYGQVAKALRGLHLSGDVSALPARGTRLFKDGKDVGYLTSATHSPRLGSVIALGYVRREANGPGVELAVGAPEAACRASIVPLPFVGPLLA